MPIMWEVLMAELCFVLLCLAGWALVSMSPPNLVYFDWYAQRGPVEFDLDTIRTLRVGSVNGGVQFENALLSSARWKMVHEHAPPVVGFKIQPRIYWQIILVFETKDANECLTSVKP